MIEWVQFLGRLDRAYIWGRKGLGCACRSIMYDESVPTGAPHAIQSELKSMNNFWVPLGLGIPLIVAETQSRMREQTLYLSEKRLARTSKNKFSGKGSCTKGS